MPAAWCAVRPGWRVISAGPLYGPALRRCLLLLIDGLRPDVAERELAAGHLPHLEALTASGTRTRAVTAFPSTTSVAYLPFLTGELPGRCNIPSIRWIDRTAYHGKWWRDRDAVRSYCGYQAGLLDRDIAPDVPTIFERIPGSAAVFSMITRGLGRDQDMKAGARKFWGAVSHFTEWHQPADDAVARGLLDAVNSPAPFVFAQFPAVDGYTHADRPDGPNVLRALVRVDVAIGAAVALLSTRKELDDTMVLVVSDHGGSRVHSHLDLAQWFRSRGAATMSHPVLWTRDPRAAVMVAGNGSAAVYVRPGHPRPTRIPFDALRLPETFGTPGDLMAELLEEDAVALLAADNGAGGIRVASRAGEADITSRHGVIEYEIRTGDPLTVGGPFTGTAEDWLARTIDGPFPDAAVSLLDQFSSPRSGDLIVAAAEGWDLRERWEYPEHHAGHGSLIAAHMLTPAWSNRALPSGPLRTVDLHGVILDWLGVVRG